ncbi:N-acetyllactosaminide beta-1,6-N-acetylglucosaminyl-transferase-like [Physella acuta]|uniref:N-acetyllactosaminide beta-1,6-N-acetylglucosaminyl-transferase-like n=1 Tax=Physella acuta TaxID=109671 RepID=UPI0027DC2E9F|nr:N-acetyllactosaminide beta-1,6-N-acetylglucosaminyl-transferase-like [Physella acuta]
MRFIKRGCKRKITGLVGALVCLCTLWCLKLFDVSKFLGKRRCEDVLTRFELPTRPVNFPHPVRLRNISAAYKRGWVGFRGLVGCDCTLAFNASTVKNSLFPQKVDRIFPLQYIEESNDCAELRDKYGFLRHPPALEEELKFPIAFVILFYKDLDQVLFLLRAIYRPHNVYCLSVDTKSSVEFLEAVRAVSRCLPNVFVASKLENIVYAGFSRLMADIHCMEDLLLHPVQWRYVINMPGQQFPLRSNLELVEILKIYNGANDVEGLVGHRMLAARYQFKHIYVKDETTGEEKLVKTGEKNAPPPHQLEIVKGSAYGTFAREFVNFVVRDTVARDFLAWCKTISSPDEYFWATLHHSHRPDIPGHYTGQPDKKPWLTTYASWGGRDPCATIHTRGVCIFSPEDLPGLVLRPELFANKFYITHYPAALHCLDELLFNLTFARAVRDLSTYRQLPFVIQTQPTNKTNS